MKRPSLSRFRSHPVIRHCSMPVLAALGALAVCPPIAAQGAGAVLPPRTLPVLRGVVGTSPIFDGPKTSSDPSRLTITQSTPRAILDWKSFNISGDSEVTFIHELGTSASTLNRIYSQDPTIIQGKLTAVGPVIDARTGARGPGGTLILLNQNGILFDRGSQVNVHTLVASTLNLSNDAFNSGSLTTGGRQTPAFAGGYDSDGTTLPNGRPDGTRPGVIGIGTFGSGSAAAPAINAGAGGSVILVATRIDNEGGIITAPDGQVILAAGSKAYLSLPEDGNTVLRGFAVEVEAGGGNNLNLTNLIRNAGDISADRGNVTLAALAVNQQGRVSAGTAIQANGSIYLKARNASGGASGTVTLAAGSTTQVMPDNADTATLPESSSFLDRRGEIDIDARSIVNAGTLQAAGGRLVLNASDAVDPTAASVYLERGSITSVAGNWADVPFASNLLTFKVTSNELKDAPDQKTGILKGATVTVDLRKGSPLLNLSGYVAAQARTVGQKTASGGEMVVNSTGALIQREGAALDASGGGYRYDGGRTTTSVLLGTDGRSYSISTAPEQRTYSALLDSYTRTDAKYNESVTYTGLLNSIAATEAGYVEGKPGGLITLNSAAGMVLDGTLKGGVTIGPNQLSKAPRGANLTIGFFDGAAGDFDPSQRIGNITVVPRSADTLGSSFNSASALSSRQKDNLILGADRLFGSAGGSGDGARIETAFDRVEINSNGRFTVAGDVVAEGAAGSTLVVRAPQVDIFGQLTLQGGSISLTPQATLAPLTPDLGLGNGHVTLHGGSLLSTSGLWLNNATVDGSSLGQLLPSARQNIATDGTLTTSSLLNGGTVSISAGDGTSATLLERGSAIDVGGGGALSASRSLSGGNGGTINLTNGFSSSQASDWLQGSLTGYALSRGGRLSINTPRVQIAPPTANGVLPSSTLRLTTDWFSDYGFSSFAINTAQGMDIDPASRIVLRQKNLQIDALTAAALPAGSRLASAASVVELPDFQRSATSLSLTARADARFAGQSQLVLPKGAAIFADPGATVSMTATDLARIDGSIQARGGSVSLALSAPITGAPDAGIGQSADIDVSAVFVRRPNDAGLIQGTMIDAGSISISAGGTGIDLAANARLNLSGLTQLVQSADPQTGKDLVEQRLDGNAGLLTLRSQGQSRVASLIAAQAGSPTGAGGSFVLEQTSPNPISDQVLVVPARIILSQNSAAQPGPTSSSVDAVLSASVLQQSGFQKLRLQAENAIEFRGDVAMDFARGLRLDAPLFDVTGDGSVGLRSASSVTLMQSLNPRNLNGIVQIQGASPALPTRAGAGNLQVNAGTIDLFGSITINGVSDVGLHSRGDIRLTGRSNLGEPGTDHPTGQAIGSLTSRGNVELDAAQVYPTTRSSFAISVIDRPSGQAVSGGYIHVVGNGAAAGDVYSANGRMTLQADIIEQSGALMAPLGTIALRAASLLELNPGSVTSTSASGLTLPFGSTSAGLQWSYQDNITGGTANVLLASSADNKTLRLGGKTVNIASGASVDLSGGGDVQAIEFVPGNGGTVDTFTKTNTYAIIPKSQLGAMPIDTDTATRYGSFVAGSTTQSTRIGFQSPTLDTDVYDTLHIGSGAIVPAGDYALLPARYALLPNAYLVQLQVGASYTNLQSGQTTALANGQTVVAGWRALAGTGIRESSTVGVVVRPGSAVTRESDYTITTSTYFSNLARSTGDIGARVPIDAGRLAIQGARSLLLAGELNTTPGTLSTASATTTGASAELEISGSNIAVVDRVGRNDIGSEFLQISGQQLTQFGGSVLLGGERSRSGGVESITTSADTIIIANDSTSALQATEVSLTANQSIQVRAGSVLAGAGEGGREGDTVKLGSAGAFMRLSSGSATQVDRGPATATSTGEIHVDAGATLRASGSLLLDATKSTRFRGTLDVASSGELSLASSQVSLGATDGVAGIDSGLVLSNADLAGLTSLKSLTLKGYQFIDLYGSAAVGSTALGSLTLNTPLLRGQGSATSISTISASALTLVNSGSAVTDTRLARTGTLSLSGNQLTLGAGDKLVRGFQSVAMNADSEIVAQGKGSVQVGGDWTLAAPKIGAAAGSVQSWQAVDSGNAASPGWGRMELQTATGTAGTSTDLSAGGRLSLAANSISVATTLQAHSGSIEMTAKGSGSASGIVVAPGGRLDASGLSIDFNGRAATTDGGTITLAAPAGDVSLQSGSTVSLSAAPGGGRAGSLNVIARQFDLQGSVAAEHAGEGNGGNVALDVSSLAALSPLARTLNAAGFDETVDIRLRQGNLGVDATSDNFRFRAHHLQLAADNGRIDVGGIIDASSRLGDGSVALWASNGIALAAGSLVDVRGTSTDAGAQAKLSNGGSVRITATGSAAQMSARAIDFSSGATIDVSQGARGSTGSVAFGVERDAAGTLAPVALSGTVRGSQVVIDPTTLQAVTDAATGASRVADAEVVLQAQRTYSSSGELSFSTYAADNASFINAADASLYLGGLRNGSGVASNNVALRGATQVKVSGAATVSTAVDLTSSQWRARGQPGTLTLRSVGDLTISAALGNPGDAIIAGKTWGIRLVAGADLDAANPLATNAAATAGGTGNVVLSGDAAKVRTGTGSIEVAAASDFLMTGVRSVMYTAGRIGATDAIINGNNRWAREGGAITIRAGRDAVGAADEWITEWLRRPRLGTSSASWYPEWWAYRPNFQQGVATLAGGNLSIQAGRDVSRLSAMVPTTARGITTASGQRTLDVQGGGDLQVKAGNDLIGGSYLVARGDGEFQVAGTLGRTAPTQFFMMGASGSTAPAHAAFTATSGSDLTLQSVNNPTVVYQANSAGTGPSFTPPPGLSQVVTYFTYSADSAVQLLAKSGTVTLGTQMNSGRGLGTELTLGDTSSTGAYPASVTAVALQGDVALNLSNKTRILYTYPSTSARVALLAQGSVLDPQLVVSDRRPETVLSVDAFANRSVSAYATSQRLLTGDDLKPDASGRQVVRDETASADYALDIQALTGIVGISGQNSVILSLPFKSRVRADGDIAGIGFRLQNLNDTDVTVVKSDSASIRPSGLQIGGPGRLVLQAAGDVDVGQSAVLVGSPSVNLGGLIATGNQANPALGNGDAARMTILSGVKGNLDLAKLDIAYEQVKYFGNKAAEILSFYRELNGDPDPAAVLAARSVVDLVKRDPAYAAYSDLVGSTPRLLTLYQDAVRNKTLPLGTSEESRQAAALYAQLNFETDAQAIASAKNLTDLISRLGPSGAAYQSFVALDSRYPLVFADYRQRRSKGGLPEGLTPILYSEFLQEQVAKAVPASAVGSGSILTYQSSIQTYGNANPDPHSEQGSIDLWAPGGKVIAGLTTPPGNTTIGVVTNAGGAIRSVVGDDFSINSGKVLSAQGGEILLYSIIGSIDAGKGAKTSITTPPPKRTAILDPVTGAITGYRYSAPSGAAGSGIQTLTSDPDGLGPLVAPKAGDIFLLAPGGTIDAGEAGIRSSGNIVVAAQTVRNADSISASGSSQGVPKVESGSVASTVASTGTSSTSASRAAEESANTAATRAATQTAPVARPTILSVEVLGFGDRNCKEDDKDCFAK